MENMRERIPAHKMNFQMQKKHKPKFEDFCAYYLTDDTLKEGMAQLFELFSSLNLKIRWCAFNAYNLIYKGTKIGFLEIGGKVQIANCKMNWLRISVSSFADKQEAANFEKIPDDERCDKKCVSCKNAVDVELQNKKRKRVCKYNNYAFEKPGAEQFRWIEEFVKMKIKRVDEIKSERKTIEGKNTSAPKSIPQVETFVEHLTDRAREFYLRMEKLLECDKVIVKHGKNSISYFPNTGLKQQPLVLRYTIDNNGLTVELKLNFVGYYTNIIEKMPEHIKGVLRDIKHCRLKMCSQGLNCGMRRAWTLDGKHYYLCSYKFYFHPDISDPNDAEYYAEIIKAEAAAAIGRKKHMTSMLS